MQSGAEDRRPHLSSFTRHVVTAWGFALAPLLWPSVATADPHLAWGTPLDRAQGPCELQLRRCDDGCFAEVAFLNRHLQGQALARRFALSLDGLEVVVTIEDGTLRAPDRFSVVPPPGLLAEPSFLDVDEDATGVIVLRPMPVS